MCALQAQSAPETIGSPVTATAYSEIALVAVVSAQELPREIAGAKLQDIIIRAATRRPGGTDIVPGAFHAPQARISNPNERYPYTTYWPMCRRPRALAR